MPLPTSSGWREPGCTPLRSRGLTTAVCLILYVIAILDYPFNSGVSVQPDAFELVLRVIQG